MGIWQKLNLYILVISDTYTPIDIIPLVVTISPNFYFYRRRYCITDILVDLAYLFL